ncbi:uncharacterized protein LOC123535157 [Mercenaria mercenaria]|uniref:uncharacterized protein LOC123535157 n=1 Tax=Mercenaria mercenaria TaxID=6596 RepID=UPI00234E7ED8|nr:uncharacterized protein LOC123535157 [Mercenaria mercenaria]
MRTQGRWDRMQWQLDPYKWYLQVNPSSRYERRHYNKDCFVFLPQRYERKFFSNIMKLLSKEGTFGCLILLVICFTIYMHTSLLDNSQPDYIPVPMFTFTRVNYSEKGNVMVAIIMHQPSKYLKTTLISLNHSNHAADIFIFRNYSRDPIQKDVLQWCPTANVISDKGRTHSMDIAQFVMEHFISSKYDVLVYINSYSVLFIDWWDTLKDCLTQSRGFVSLYAIERNAEHADKCNDLLCCQAWMGMVGSVWRRNLAERVMSETFQVQGNLHYKMEFWCRMFSIPLQTVKNSVIAVIDSEKRNYDLISHKISTRQRMQQHVTAVKIRADFLTNRSKAIQKKMLPLENLAISNTTYKAPECIAAVLRVHIFRKERSILTAYEIEQWIRYMQHAGVNIVYLYDAYQNKDEKLEMWVKQVFDPNEVIYHDWYFNNTFPVQESRLLAYQHAIDHYKDVCEWHMRMDMNEYPFITTDTEKGFLKRLLNRVNILKPNSTEILFPVFQFSGNLTQEQWLIGRFQYRYANHSGKVRPLYKAKCVKTARQNNNELEKGNTERLDPKLARINWYLDVSTNMNTTYTTEPLDEIIPDSSIFPLLQHLKQDILISNKMPLYVTNQFWDSMN